MCMKINGVNATELSAHLLEKYGVGTIAVNDTDLRVAFSCIEEENISELFSLIFQAWKDLR